MTLPQEVLTKINTGRTATIFGYGEEKVLKLYRPSFPEKVIEEEFQIGLQLNNIDLDVPHTYELVDYNGSKGIVFDYIQGESMLQLLATKPWRVIVLSVQMARLHFKIHTTRIPQTKNIPSLKESLLDKISKVSLLNSAEKEMIVSHLSSLQNGLALCHGDFHPDNILISRKGLMTVDWLTARTGNPLADVARTWLLLTMGTLPENKTNVEVLLAKCLRGIFCRHYLGEYKKLSNLCETQLENWKLPIAAARLVENVSEKENQELLNFIHLKLRKELFLPKALI